MLIGHGMLTKSVMLVARLTGVGCMWNGCSGHGLSGMGLLSILSFIHIAATFASGISSAFLLRWYDML